MLTAPEIFKGMGPAKPQPYLAQPASAVNRRKSIYAAALQDIAPENGRDLRNQTINESRESMANSSQELDQGNKFQDRFNVDNDEMSENIPELNENVPLPPPPPPPLLMTEAILSPHATLGHAKSASSASAAQAPLERVNLMDDIRKGVVTYSSQITRPKKHFLTVYFAKSQRRGTTSKAKDSSWNNE